MEGLTEGRMVHYVLPDGRHRPAIVVNAWEGTNAEGRVNLQVFTDFSNDLWAYKERDEQRDNAVRSGQMWETSVAYSDGKEPGTWHWIERA